MESLSSPLSLAHYHLAKNIKTTGRFSVGYRARGAWEADLYEAFLPFPSSWKKPWEKLVSEYRRDEVSGRDL